MRYSVRSAHTDGSPDVDEGSHDSLCPGIDPMERNHSRVQGSTMVTDSTRVMREGWCLFFDLLRSL